MQRQRLPRIQATSTSGMLQPAADVRAMACSLVRAQATHARVSNLWRTLRPHHLHAELPPRNAVPVQGMLLCGLHPPYLCQWLLLGVSSRALARLGSV